MSAAGKTWATFLIAALVATPSLTACGGSGGGGGGGNPRGACEDLNNTQREVTKLGDDLSAATSNDQNEALTSDANAVNKDLSGALASGAFSGTRTETDLQTAIHAVQQIEDDLLKPDVAKASLDVGALKNAMSNLGGDCSRYLD